MSAVFSAQRARAMPVLATVLLLACHAGLAQAAEPVDLTPYRLRVGFFTFESPEELRQPRSSYQTIAAYLQELSDRSRDTTSNFTRPVDFELVVGNYYQVYEWLRTAQIDAAIVSPFTAKLLEGQVDRVVGFSQHNQLGLEGWTGQGHLPIIQACSTTTSVAPTDQYGQFIDELWQQAQYNTKAAPAPCRVYLVAHLSSSGFLAPVLFTDAILHQRQKAKGDAHEHRFWNAYFDSACFTFSHGPNVCDKTQGPTTFSFAYSGRSDIKSNEWNAYGFGVLKRGDHPSSTELFSVPDPSFVNSDTVIIPNDVFVLRKQARQIIDADRNALWCDPESRAFRTATGYTKCRPYHDSDYDRFDAAVDAFKAHEPLRKYYTRWYKLGDYEFTVDDILAFLAQDQGNQEDKRLSLVLPGGGVKGAYQSKMLDLLYGCDRLRNHADTRSLLEKRTDAVMDKCKRLAGTFTRPSKIRPLVVDTVVGTSGGALVGAFVAQIPRDLTTGDFVPLSGLWSGVTHRNVFADVDSLRWVSLCLVLSLLWLCVSVAAARGRLAPVALSTREDEQPGDTPLRIAVLFTLLLIIHPIGRRLLDVYALSERTIFLVGLDRALILLAIHLCITCIRHAPRRSAGPRQRAAIMILAVACGALPWITWLITLWFQSVAMDALWDGLCLGIPVAVVVLLAINRRGPDLDGDLLALYFKALGVVVFFALLVVAGMALAIWNGLTTTLELTPEYWLTLISVSLISGLLTLVIGTRLAGLKEGLSFLVTKHRVASLPVTPAASLLAVACVGVGWWLWVGAAGLYGNQKADEYLQHQLVDYARQNADGTDSDSPVNLRTRLVVTGSAMDKASIGECAKEPKGGESIPKGDLYFCFDREGACKATTAARLFQVEDFTAKVMAQPIFASGSPFPIFPAHKIQVPITGTGAISTNEAPYFCGAVIDGGYGHNVPVHAAEASGARQVLIVRSAPVPRAVQTDDGDGRLLERLRKGTMRERLELLFDISRGPLMSNVGKLFGFMFDLSQAVDDRTTRALVVASIAPLADAETFPPLTDFRSETVKRMLETATHDWNRRVGRIESWGPPNYAHALSLHGNNLRLRAPGWSTDARDELQHQVQRTTAVFDFDNTCIKNDLGEAVFLRLVADRAYHDGEGFWNLIEEPARSELQAFRRAHPKDESFDLSKPSSWTDDFKNYLVLFIQQYEERLRSDTGGAYQWVVQLFAGMTAKEVEDLTYRVWKDQVAAKWKDDLGCDICEYTIQSTKHGSAQINLGIRRYAEIGELIRHLQNDLGWDLWIATASSVYSVRAVANLFDVSPSHVIGMELVESDNGVLTPEITVSTYGQGKWDAIVSKGLKPALVAGDSMTDFVMLQHSTGVALVIDRGKIPKQLTEGVANGPTWIFQPATTLTLTEEAKL